jgi:hypothetical protein
MGSVCLRAAFKLQMNFCQIDEGIVQMAHGIKRVSDPADESFVTYST